MSFLDRLLGRHVEILSAAEVAGSPIAMKETSSVRRIPKQELEAAFLNCGLVKEGIVKKTQIIMSGEPVLECEDKEVLKYFNDFLDNIGNIGTEIHWNELLSRIFQDQFVFGDSWVEKIYNRNQTRIVDLDIIDPKSMDYAKYGTKIALDKYGAPLGYTQVIPFGQRDIARKKIAPPKDVTLMGSMQWIPKQSIAHFMLYKSSGFYPIGVIEPVYQDIYYYLKLKKAYGEKASTILFPRLWAKVGDKSHLATPQVLKDIIEKMKTSHYKTEIATPQFVDLNILEAKHPDSLLNFLNFYADQILISIGLPKPLVTGLGEATNRATLNVQTYISLLSTRDIIKKTVKTIEHEIFRPIALLEGFGTEEEPIYPRINWNFQKVEDSIKHSIEKGDKADVKS